MAKPPSPRPVLSPAELAQYLTDHQKRVAYWKRGKPVLVERLGDHAKLTYYDHEGYGFILNDQDGDMNFAREMAWGFDRDDPERRCFIGLFEERYVERAPEDVGQKDGKEKPP